MKKDFKNAAEQFISNSPSQVITESSFQINSLDVPEGYKLNPMFVELKSKRVQLILQPSLYKKVKMKADEEGLSFNEYVHRVLLKNVN